MTLRQSPIAVTSSAPTIAGGLAEEALRRGCRRRAPACRSTSGAGMPATKSPNCGLRQRPDLDGDRAPPPRHAHHARPPRRAARQARRAGSRAPSRTARRKRPPSRVSSPLSGSPDMCAPQTASSISSGAAADSAGRPAARGQPGRAERRSPQALDPRARALASSPSRPAAREQRDAARPAVAPRRRRHGEAAEVEQVDEIGVGAEPCVRPDRIGGDLVAACTKVGIDGTQSRSIRASTGSTVARAAPRAGRSRGRRRPPRAPSPAR